METALKTEGTSKVLKNVTYPASSKESKEVLLMTCRIEVTAPDSSTTQARALLDCAASTSLITECLALISYVYPSKAATLRSKEFLVLISNQGEQ